MGYSNRLRIGLMVPSSNTTMEPEFYSMVPSGVSVHTSRMELEEVTTTGLTRMAEEAERAARLLATADVDVIIYGCTTGSLVGGVEWEKRLVQSIEEDTNTRAFSTSWAVVEAIKSLDGDSVSVATPYTDDLNRLERAFLESYGLKVNTVRGLGLVRNLEIGITELTVVEELVRATANGSDIIFISCTNLPTIGLIGKLEAELGRPIVTSNQASIWAALRGSGVTGIEGFGELLRSRL